MIHKELEACKEITNLDLLTKIIQDAYEQKHPIEYFLKNSFRQDKLLVFDNSIIEFNMKLPFFRELMYFYETYSVLEYIKIERYTLAFWNNYKKCYCGIYNSETQKILNQKKIENYNIILNLPPYTYTRN